MPAIGRDIVDDLRRDDRVETNGEGHAARREGGQLAGAWKNVGGVSFHWIIELAIAVTTTAERGGVGVCGRKPPIGSEAISTIGGE